MASEIDGTLLSLVGLATSMTTSQRMPAGSWAHDSSDKLKRFIVSENETIPSGAR